MAAPKNNDTRKLILEKTTLLMQENNFYEVTLKDIAKSCQISKGTLYYYYNNKNDILLDITENYLQKQLERFLIWAENCEKDTSPRRMIKYVLEFGTDKSFGNLRIYLISEAISGNNKIKEKLNHSYRTFVDVLSEKLDLKQAELISYLTVFLTDSLIIHRLLESNDEKLENLISNFSQLLATL